MQLGRNYRTASPDNAADWGWVGQRSTRTRCRLGSLPALSIENAGNERERAGSAGNYERAGDGPPGPQFRGKASFAALLETE